MPSGPLSRACFATGSRRSRANPANGGHGEQTKEALDPLLQPAQAQRLFQLTLQQTYGKAKAVPTIILNDEDAAAELKLTAAQKDQLSTLQQEFNLLFDLALVQDWGDPVGLGGLGGLAGGGGKGGVKAGKDTPFDRAIQGLNKTLDERRLAVLTPEQRQRFQTILGEPLSGQDSPDHPRASGVSVASAVASAAPGVLALVRTPSSAVRTPSSAVA